MCINNLGHMTKMAAMPIYGKNPSKIFFSETNSFKETWREAWYSNLYINHDPVVILTSLWQGQHGLPMHLNGENC